MLARKRRPRIACRVAICLLALLAGRAQAGERPSRGWQRFRQAAVGALRDPGTWIPAGGAVVFAAAGWDDNLSEWATRETPLFGSRHRALAASNDLLVAGNAAMVATAFLAPPPGQAKRAWKTIAVEETAYVLTSASTEGFKGLTLRVRPNESSDDSFPSGHASLAFAAAAASSRNVAASRLSRRARLGASIALRAAAAGTAWARVEAGVHFPTDVLAGAALGNFVSLLIHDAFLEDRRNPRAMLSFESDGAALTLCWTLPR